jgi:hypothetical protein
MGSLHDSCNQGKLSIEQRARQDLRLGPENLRLGTINLCSPTQDSPVSTGGSSCPGEINETDDPLHESCNNDRCARCAPSSLGSLAPCLWPPKSSFGEHKIILKK